MGRFLSLSELPKKDNLSIRKKKERIGDNEPRDFYFNLLVRKLWNVALHFSRVKFFFLFRGKSRIRFLSLEVRNFGKSGLSKWIAEHARMERFLGAEFNGEIWNFSFSEASSNFQPQKKNLNRYKFSSIKISIRYISILLSSKWTISINSLEIG